MLPGTQNAYTAGFAGGVVGDGLGGEVRRTRFEGFRMNRTVLVELLDSAQSYAVQSWTFAEKDRIMIGRSPENDVVVSDPYVSRSHAYLCWEGGCWRLISISSQQVLCDGQLRNEAMLVDDTVFRLGANGAFLRFVEADAPAEQKNAKTLQYDPALMPVFKLDNDKLEREVAEISASNYFQQLKQAAQTLRQQRSASKSP